MVEFMNKDALMIKFKYPAACMQIFTGCDWPFLHRTILEIIVFYDNLLTLGIKLTISLKKKKKKILI